MSPEAILARYQASNVRTEPIRIESLMTERLVCVDTEATGLDIRKDRLVSIGAIGIEGNSLLLDDTFAVVMPVSWNTSSVLIHGITREASLSGIPEPEALLQWLNYLGGAIIVGHHIRHDVQMLEDALQRHFECALLNPFCDTTELMQLLIENGQISKDAVGGFSLDAFASFFGVMPHDRHTATGDAFITAQIFQKLMLRIRKHERLLQCALPLDAHLHW
jgi:DNA polymerase-3 subunit epsilon